MPRDYLAELLESIRDDVKEVKTTVNEHGKSLEDIRVQTTKTNGKVKQLEKDVKKLETSKGKKLDLEPRTLYLIAMCCLIILVIVATRLKINLGSLV